MGQRSAVSIARRLQDPLAELVKIDPKSIGVGQYQHDMNQKKLDEMLHGTVEDCVNQVGRGIRSFVIGFLGSLPIIFVWVVIAEVVVIVVRSIRKKRKKKKE